MGNNNRSSVYKGYYLFYSQNHTLLLFSSYQLVVEKMEAQRGKNLAPGHTAKKASPSCLTSKPMFFLLCRGRLKTHHKPQEQRFLQGRYTNGHYGQEKMVWSLNHWKFKSNHKGSYSPLMKRMINNKKKTSIGEDRKEWAQCKLLMGM